MSDTNTIPSRFVGSNSGRWVIPHSDLSDNWEFVGLAHPSHLTRMIKCKTPNMIGTYNYRIQRKYWLIGWVTIAYFSATKESMISAG